LHDQHVLPIRQALAKNITALKNLNPVDIAGLLCQLDAIQENSDRLSFKPINAHKTSIASITAAAAPKDWQDKLKNNLAFLENLVSIHHYDGTVLPVPTPLLESLLREELRLSIKEAQWALLQNNQSVYQRSLIDAIKTSKRAFADTHQIIPPLEALQKIHLTKNKVFSDEALMLLNQWIESRMQAPLETKSNKVEPLP
jgi:uroporphyrin-3 C-methyltransferase